MKRISPTILILLVALGAMVTGADSCPGQAQDPESNFALRAARIYTLQGDPGYIENAWIEIRGSRVVGIGTGEAPDDLDVEDLGSSVIIPGLVSTRLRSGVEGGNTRLGAQWVAADNFNPYGNWESAWRNGITSARMAPTGRQFLAGVASAVKLGASPGHAKVLSRMTDLVVAFDALGGRSAPAEGEVSIPSSSDVPIVPGTLVRPQTRLGRIQALEDLLARSLAQKDGDPRGADYDPRLTAMDSFLQTGGPVRLEARRAADILEAIAAVKRTRLKSYIAGLDEALVVAEDIVSSGLPVVLEMKTKLDDLGSNQVDGVTPWRRDVRAAGLLQSRGVQVVLGAESDDLLLAAQLAVGGGMDRRQALAAVTSGAAEMLGIGSVAGTLAVGRDADFAVLNGDPFSSRTHVQQTWVSGQRAWSRRVESEALVIRAGKIYDGTGRVFLGGEVLVDNGKIVACGHSVGHPANARIVEAGPDAVITPGFIDLHGHLGLGSGRGSAGADVRIADGFAAADRDFLEVARGGITSVVAAPKQVGSGGAQMAVIKTMGRGRDEVISKDLAGLKLKANGTGESTRKAMDALLQKARKYHEEWVKYQEALAKYNAEQKTGSVDPEPVKTETVEEKSEERKEDPITGTWKGTVSAEEIPVPIEIILEMKLLTGNNIVGQASLGVMGQTIDGLGLNGKLEGKKVTLEIDPPSDLPIPVPPEKGKLEATLDRPDHMAGDVDIAGDQASFEATRTKKGAPAIKVTTTKRKVTWKGPKKPKSQPTLDPFRRVFEGKAGVLVETTTPAQAKAVADVFSKYKIKPCIMYPKGFEHVMDGVRGRVSVMLPTVLTRVEDRRTILIPDELDRAGVDVAFQSGAGAAAARLPQLARAAVRSGMNPETALSALTYTAARMLKIDDVVGSLQRGRDGDILVFDGEPFEASSRLLRVFVRGREVR